MITWELPAKCDCSWCKPRGGKNNHAWSFYYFLKKVGDNPKVKVRNGTIYISVWKRSNGKR